MGHHQVNIRYNYSQPALESLFETTETITDDRRIGGATILKAVSWGGAGEVRTPPALSHAP